MRFNNVLMAISICFLIGITSAHAEELTGTQGEIPTVQIPIGSALTVAPQICQSNIYKFDGEIELEGKLDVYWYQHVIDAASPTDLLTETRLGIDFYPSKESQNRLPTVFFADEPPVQTIRIRLGDLGHRQAESLLLMFGFQETKKMMRQKKNQSFLGRITLSTFSTYMECNNRHFDGEAIAFKQESGPIKLNLSKISQSCGG